MTMRIFENSRTWQLLWVAIVAGPIFGTVCTASAQSLYVDSEFSINDQWQIHGPLVSPAGAQGAVRNAFQVSSDGNPGAFLRFGTGHPPVTEGASQAWTFMIKENAVYDPSDPRAGPIDNILFEFDARLPPGGRLDRVVSLAVMQEGYLWAVVDQRIFVGENHLEWTAFQIADLQEADFSSHIWGEAGQPATPDFSAAGVPMAFGIVTGNSCPDTSDCSFTLLREVDIDNWQVLVTSGQPPVGAGEFRFLVDEAQLFESDDGVWLDVWRVNGADGIATVDYRTVAQTATEDADYEALSGTLTFGDVDSAEAIRLTIIDDGLPEDDETLSVELSNPTGGAILRTPSTAFVEILDDDSTPMADLGLELSVDALPSGGLVLDELPFQYEMTATLTNNGPWEISNIVVDFGIPKLHLAGFDIPDDSDCSPATDGNTDFVVVECTIAGPMAKGESILLPQQQAIYSGYAGTVPDGSAFEYGAGIQSFDGDDTDTSNNAPRFTIKIQNADGVTVPPKKKTSTGSVGLPLLLVLSMMYLRRRRRSLMCHIDG